MRSFRLGLLSCSALLAPSDSAGGAGSGTQTSPAPTPPTPPGSTLNAILQDATIAAQVAASSGNPIAIGAAAGTSLVSGIVGDVESAQAAHQTAIQTTDDVLGHLSTTAAPVISVLPSADQTIATEALAALGAAWNLFKSVRWP